MQEFRTIDTYSYLYLVYIGAAIICGCCPVVSLLRRAHRDTRGGSVRADLETFPLISRLLRTRRAERHRRIPRRRQSDGVVAHYDSARSALSFSPSWGNFRLSFSMISLDIRDRPADLANLIVRARHEHQPVGLVATL